MKDLTTLLTTTAGGLALMFVALLLRRKRPDWVGWHALFMLAGGIAAIKLVGLVLNKAIQWTQDGLTWVANWAATWGGPGPVVHGVVSGIGSSLPWILGIGLSVWLLIDLFPRVSALRGGQGGMRGAAGMPVGGGSGGWAGRLAAVHSAESHTMWIALLVPAAFVLVTPLAHLLKIGA